MDRCIGIINGGDNENNFGGLCKHRPVYMLPFAGRYRLIDFTISNMVNNGIKSVAIYTGKKMRSTMDHIGNGNPWDLNRRFNGLFLFPPILENDYGLYTGDVHQYHSTEPFFEHAKEKYVFICNPNIIAKVDLAEAFKCFTETDADVTLIYKKQIDDDGDFINKNKIIIDKDGNLKSMGINLGTESEFNLSLEMGFLKKEIFLEIVRGSVERGDTTSLKDALLQNKDKYKINTYRFDGHVENISDLKNYYDANLNLLKEDIAEETFYKNGSVFTKSKDEPSTWYGKDSKVQNSLVANGCIIDGNVQNSIIFRGVKIGKDAVVRNSIVMQKSVIEKDAIVVNSILDKYTCIEEGANIAGNASMPYVIEKNQKIRRDEK
nr:glucose-1-phosphate adenylyltransferase subunit GlgD [Tissierella sp.]